MAGIEIDIDDAQIEPPREHAFEEKPEEDEREKIRRREAAIDEAGEESFPASDPPAY